MKITYQIKKKRGNWRPILTYQCGKEDWEKELLIPGGETDITIDASLGLDNHCLGSQSEKSENFKPSPYNLRFPLPEENDIKRNITLVWKPGNNPEYPEIDEAFRLFMEEWERRTIETLESGTINLEKEIEHTSGFKKKIAPFVAARKMLGEE